MTNAQILTEVLLKWAEPVLPAITSTAVGSISKGLLPFEKFMKNWGLAGEGWSMTQEISSIVAAGGSAVARPFLQGYIAKIPDSMIPEIAHGYVDGAIKQGSLTLFDRFTFEKSDLEKLKKYLDYNLPMPAREKYEVVIPDNINTEAQTV